MSNGIEENGEENINFEHVNVLCFLFTDYAFHFGTPDWHNRHFPPDDIIIPNYMANNILVEANKVSH